MSEAKLFDLSRFEKCLYCDRVFVLNGLKLHMLLKHKKLIQKDMEKLFNKFNKKEKKIIKIIGGKRWERF